MLKIFKYLKIKEWQMILSSVVLMSVQVWLDLKIPEYMSEITRLLQTPGTKVSDVWDIGAYMVAFAFLSLISAIFVGFFASRVAASFSKDLRSAIFKKVGSFSMEEINQFSTASLITRSTNDIVQVQMVIAMGLHVIIRAPIMATLAILKILGKSWQWTLTTAVAVLFLMVLIFVIFVFVMPRFKKIQEYTDNLNNITRENLTGLRVVRAYNAEDFQEKKFLKASKDLAGTYLFVTRIMSVIGPGMSLMMGGINLAIYWTGAHIINGAGVADRVNLFSDMVVFSSYAMQIVMSFMMLTMIFIIAPRAAVSARRINEVLDKEPTITDGRLSIPPNGIKGEVEFKNVSFKYPDAAEYVLKDISFKANRGETVAFIGSTGSGKSTLVNLIPRFYDATNGEVLLDGINVKDYKLEDLHNKLGVVTQKAVLFSGSVSSNITYGDSGSKTGDLQENVKKAARIAQATQFVEEMEDKYDSAIAQGGTNVSGGQKQRISIARAVYRDPEIYIFDDSFSALDYKTDHALRTALKKEAADKTNLIVAQRIGTIKNADKIIVLEQGEAVGIGTHAQLLKTCEVYREIAYSQLSKEELDDEQ
ncbi:MAG: ABC transporter ATP-binding protein/permease [Oscillospiraceae bacterium]|jgi:ATP-binding cassette subfamily B protein|nr:ABC transporter ATP-binding protein/permease [Oscillospiraceae bacterium]